MWNPKEKQNKSIIALFSHGHIHPCTILQSTTTTGCGFVTVNLRSYCSVTLSNNPGKAAANRWILSVSTVHFRYHARFGIYVIWWSQALVPCYMCAMLLWNRVGTRSNRQWKKKQHKSTHRLPLHIKNINDLFVHDCTFNKPQSYKTSEGLLIFCGTLY